MRIYEDNLEFSDFKCFQLFQIDDAIFADSSLNKGYAGATLFRFIKGDEVPMRWPPHFPKERPKPTTTTVSTTTANSTSTSSSSGNDTSNATTNNNSNANNNNNDTNANTDPNAGSGRKKRHVHNPLAITLLESTAFMLPLKLFLYLVARNHIFAMFIGFTVLSKNLYDNR